MNLIRGRLLPSGLSVRKFSNDRGAPPLRSEPEPGLEKVLKPNFSENRERVVMHVIWDDELLQGRGGGWGVGLAERRRGNKLLLLHFDPHLLCV